MSSTILKTIFIYTSQKEADKVVSNFNIIDEQLRGAVAKVLGCHPQQLVAAVLPYLACSENDTILIVVDAGIFLTTEKKYIEQAIEQGWKKAVSSTDEGSLQSFSVQVTGQQLNP